MIDWELIVKNHNEENKTEYKGRKELLQALYLIHKSAYILAEMLIVSHTTIYKAFKADGISVIQYSQRITLRQKKMKEMVEAGMNKNLTARQMGELVGVSKQHAQVLIRRFRKEE